MNRLMQYRLALMYSAAAASAALASSCANRDYDVQSHQTMRSAQAQPPRPAATARRSDAREERAYRRFLAEQNLPYREYALLGPQEQNAYVVWRNAHPDAGA